MIFLKDIYKPFRLDSESGFLQSWEIMEKIAVMEIGQLFKSHGKWKKCHEKVREFDFDIFEKILFALPIVIYKMRGKIILY